MFNNSSCFGGWVDVRLHRAADLHDPRGAWKTAKPLTIGAVDLKEMGYDVKAAEKDVAQMNV